MQFTSPYSDDVSRLSSCDSVLAKLGNGLRRLLCPIFETRELGIPDLEMLRLCAALSCETEGGIKCGFGENEEAESLEVCRAVAKERGGGEE